jgi:hypothetical protein
VMVNSCDLSYSDLLVLILYDYPMFATYIMVVLGLRVHV